MLSCLHVSLQITENCLYANTKKTEISQWKQQVRQLNSLSKLLILSVKLENAYSRPFLGVFGAKMGENQNFCIFIPLGMQLTRKHAF